MTGRSEPRPNLVVVSATREFECAGCGATDRSLLKMDDAGPMCMRCVELNHLVFLPSGDAALTRRAKACSGRSAVVVRWSRSRKRYERQGILVEDAALEQAEAECLLDDVMRARRRERDAERRVREDSALQERMAADIARLLPGCPVERAAEIARHAAERGSGRVGRTAAGRALDAGVLELAVVASIRHQDTSYDELLRSGVDRALARQRVRPDVERVLNGWRKP